MAAAGGRNDVRMRDGGGSASTLPPPGPRHAGLAPHRSAAGQPGQLRTADATDGCPTC